MENTTSPNEEIVQPEQTTSTESVATETANVQSTKDTTTKEGQEGVKGDDISIPELPDDLPEDAKEYVKLSLQKAQREMQKAFTKKTQEIAQLRKETQTKVEAFEQMKQYIPILEQMKSQQVEKQPDLSLMSEEERLQHTIRSMVDQEVSPYKEKLAEMKAQEIEAESQAQEQEARDYADNIGIAFEDYIPQMIELDNENPGKYTWKQLLRILAGDEIDKLLEEKGKLSLAKSLQTKRLASPPSTTTGGTPTSRPKTIFEAFKEAEKQIIS